MRDILKGATDQSTVVRIVDSTDGTPETGVVWNTSGIDLWYRREGGLKVSITEATLAALNTVHADGGFLHIGDGYYRLDLPDAAVASGADGVAIGGTVTGMVVIGSYHQLVDSQNLTAAQVNAQVLDVLNVDTFAEIGQEAPAATQTIRKMLAFLYKAWRNKKTQTATQFSLFNDDAATVDQKSTTSDDGSVFTAGELGSGP